MLEKILNYEREAFLFLNGQHNEVLDQFMWLFSGKELWIPLILTFVLLLITKNRSWKTTVAMIIAIVVVVTVCDQFSSSICKPLFERFRPTRHPEFSNEVHTVFGYRGGKYGFISSHATNAFGFVTLTALMLRYRIYDIIMYIWATITSYSRIYLGVHFISDIIPGVLVGILFGWLGYVAYRTVNKKLAGEESSTTSNPAIFKPADFSLFFIVLTITVLSMLLIGILYSYNIIPAVQL